MSLESIGTEAPISYAAPSAWDEVKLLQDTVLRIWTIYMQWFTWFFGAELLTLSWILTSITPTCANPLAKEAAHALAYMWIVCSLLGISASIAVSIYTYFLLKRVLILAAPIQNEILLPRWLVLFAASGTALAMVAALCVWAFVARKF